MSETQISSEMAKWEKQVVAAIAYILHENTRKGILVSQNIHDFLEKVFADVPYEIKGQCGLEYILGYLKEECFKDERILPDTIS